MTKVTKFLRENLFSFLSNDRKTARGDPRVEIGLKLYFLEVIRDGIYPGEKSIKSGQMIKKNKKNCESWSTCGVRRTLIDLKTLHLFLQNVHINSLHLMAPN